MSCVTGSMKDFASENNKKSANVTQSVDQVSTPESKVKTKINRLLDKYKGMYRHMPVPYGYGASTLDYLICFRGQFIAIEAKKPGGKPTDRQKMIIAQIRAAGGTVFVIDGDTTELQNHLESIKHASHPPSAET